jgi:hypothetical protein
MNESSALIAVRLRLNGSTEHATNQGHTDRYLWLATAARASHHGYARRSAPGRLYGLVNSECSA